jgi:hypothetical protein
VAKRTERVFRVHGDTIIDGYLQVDKGFRLNPEDGANGFNIVGENDAGDDVIIFDVERNNATKTTTVIVGEGEQRLEARQTTSTNSSGYYTCSICSQKNPAAHGNANGNRAVTEGMLWKQIADKTTHINQINSNLINSIAVEAARIDNEALADEANLEYIIEILYNTLGLNYAVARVAAGNVKGQQWQLETHKAHGIKFTGINVEDQEIVGVDGNADAVRDKLIGATPVATTTTAAATEEAATG